ncbi:MAG: CBS domain-containing protein, partial [Deltaproteobacteria bacterium]|nr:CBS domain-containing protein [Deltaproteobacteria bacterium]
RSLYPSQLAARHRGEAVGETWEGLGATAVADLGLRGRPWVSFLLGTSGPDIVKRAAEARTQEVFPVLDGQGGLKGVVVPETLRWLAANHDSEAWAVAADLMQPPVSVGERSSLRDAAALLVSQGLRGVPVVEGNAGKVVAVLSQADLVAAAWKDLPPGAGGEGREATGS